MSFADDMRKLTKNARRSEIYSCIKNIAKSGRNSLVVTKDRLDDELIRELRNDGFMIEEEESEDYENERTVLGWR